MQDYESATIDTYSAPLSAMHIHPTVMHKDMRFRLVPMVGLKRDLVGYV